MLLAVQASGGDIGARAGARAPNLPNCLPIRARWALKGSGDGLPTPGPTSGLQESVDELEHGAPVGHGQALDLPEPFEESGGFRGRAVFETLHPDELLRTRRGGPNKTMSRARRGSLGNRARGVSGDRQSANAS